ncbi:sulfatase [Rubritalea spongiae]|uniref:Sulfatase n=1 Tax=Rubritalea spongiae TaxID=430797 RepID=A0ABW5E544_9BACT
MKKTIAILFMLVSAVLAETRPNIVFIFTDDWGWGDLSCHGHPYIKTPNIDRLAKEGTDFHRFTVASGVCSPSRAAVMTGQFPSRNNIPAHFATPKSNQERGMPDWLSLDAPYLAEILQQAGYRTAHYGKWHLSNEMITDSPSPGEYGYDDYGAFNCSGEQMPWYQDSARACKFIKESAKMKKPFFINVWMHEPHTPFHTIPKYEWRFRDLERNHQIYASVLSHADDRVGEILDTLDHLQLTENTLVIFSSDNGPAGGGRDKGTAQLKYDPATGAGWGTAASVGTTGGRDGRKRSLKEGGIGVPFLARWPKQIPAGNIDSESLITAVDLLPTFCALAEAPLPEGFKPDGVNIIKVLKGEKMPSREKPIFWEGIGMKKENWATVQGQWKLLATKDLSEIQLYDIAKDFKEENDLSKDQPEVAAKLLQSIKDWKKTLPKEPTGDVFSELR